MRLWLKTADCWLCGTSIQLTVEQIETAQRLLDSGSPAGSPPATRATRQVVAASPQGRVRTAAHGGAVAPPLPHTLPQGPRPVPRRPMRPSPVPVPRPKPAARPRSPLPEVRRRRWLRDLIACLTSLTFHLVLMLLLGLWTVDAEPVPQRLTLTVAISPLDRLGSPKEEPPATVEIDFDPHRDPPEDDPRRRELAQARKDAAELRQLTGQAARHLPRLADVKADLVSLDPGRRMLAARDPRVRAEIVRREGGTTLTEAAVARALRWIARHQAQDGSWSLRRFDRAGDCRGRCDGRGQIASPAGGTALALMALLGAGQTHTLGIYRQHVERGLQWLLDHQQLDGDLRGDGQRRAGMYVHGQAAIVLCDALRLSRDEQLRLPARLAIDFLCAAQSRQGGWRYVPGQPGDTSVLGWQLMAIYSAQAAGIDVPEQVLAGASRYLDRAQTDRQGSYYAYQPGGPATPTMTAEGLLSRMYLGWRRETLGLRQGVFALVRNHPPEVDRPNVYYWYYATQVMHHWGGTPWHMWNPEIRNVLVGTQQTKGHMAGSWSPRGPHAGVGGRLYMTALAACTLEVYYRHAPLYRKIDLR
jgi:hypothetical protein